VDGERLGGGEGGDRAIRQHRREVYDSGAG
jgi:hypothetical protein